MKDELPPQAFRFSTPPPHEWTDEELEQFNRLVRKPTAAETAVKEAALEKFLAMPDETPDVPAIVFAHRSTDSEVPAATAHQRAVNLRATGKKHPRWMAAIACLGIFIGYVALSAAADWTHGGGTIPMMLVFAAMTLTWKSIMSPQRPGEPQPPEPMPAVGQAGEQTPHMSTEPSPIRPTNVLTTRLAELDRFLKDAGEDGSLLTEETTSALIERAELDAAFQIRRHTDALRQAMVPRKLWRNPFLILAWVVPFLLFPTETYKPNLQPAFSEMTYRDAVGTTFIEHRVVFCSVPQAIAHGTAAPLLMGTRAGAYSVTYAMHPYWKYWFMWVGCTLAVTIVVWALASKPSRPASSDLAG